MEKIDKQAQERFQEKVNWVKKLKEFEKQQFENEKIKLDNEADEKRRLFKFRNLLTQQVIQ